MTKRRTITDAMRVRIFTSNAGVCHLCGLRIHAERGEKWHVEHVKPLWLDGEDTEANMAPAHIDCHAPKTKEEAGQRAKTNRQAARHLGATQSKAKIPSRPKAPRSYDKTMQLRALREKQFEEMNDGQREVAFGGVE